MEETKILKHDWDSTAYESYFNDNAVMSLFEMIARPENRVNSWVFKYLDDYNQPDLNRFKRRFKPSIIEKKPWDTGITTTNLDEPWIVMPFNITRVGKHWVSLLRTAVFTSETTQAVKLYYFDSINGNHYEEHVKSLLSDTPLFSTDSNQFGCEWIRINVEEQQEVECGARACLHAYIAVASVRDKDMNLTFVNSLRNNLQGLFQDKDVKEFLKKARAWA